MYSPYVQPWYGHSNCCAEPQPEATAAAWCLQTCRNIDSWSDPIACHGGQSALGCGAATAGLHYHQCARQHWSLNRAVGKRRMQVSGVAIKLPHEQEQFAEEHVVKRPKLASLVHAHEDRRAGNRRCHEVAWPP